MRRAVIGFAFVYFTVMTVAVTFPGLGLVNRIRPLIFGIPFTFAWVLAWVAVSTLVFYILYRSVDR